MKKTSLSRGGFAALCLFSSTVSAHSLNEGLAMIERGLVNNENLVVKYDDDNPRAVGPVGLRLRSVTGYAIHPLFSRGDEIYAQERNVLERRYRTKFPHLENYSLVTFREKLRVEEAQKVLREVFNAPGVSFAYFEPIYSNAMVQDEPIRAAPKSVRVAGDYESRQFHLEAAPKGVDARFAWTVPGGTGAGVKVIDVEFGWQSNHEDFKAPFFERNGKWYVDHGTAVWGEIAAKRDGKGVTGIAYDVEMGIMASESGADFELAASKLNSGDIIIIEQQGAGPDGGNYSPIEYWRANFDAIKIATAKGVVVIEAAANGNSNLDSASYGGAFDLKKRDSGAILVGAGGPPSGKWKHLERLDFSNYGSRIDAFGYGRGVVTTGYGDLFNGGPQATYTSSFSGTSSATPIVTGVIASLMGMAKAQGIRISPSDARQALRESGTPQLGDTSKRIGNLPDLAELNAYFQLPNVRRGSNEKENLNFGQVVSLSLLSAAFP